MDKLSGVSSSWHPIDLRRPDASYAENTIIPALPNVLRAVMRDPAVRNSARLITPGISCFANRFRTGVAVATAPFDLNYDCSSTELAIGFRRALAQAMLTVRCADVKHWSCCTVYCSYRGTHRIDDDFFQKAIRDFDLSGQLKSCQWSEKENHICIEVHAVVRDTAVAVVNATVPEDDLQFVFINCVQKRTSAGNSLSGTVVERVACDTNGNLLDDVNVAKLRKTFNALSDILTFIDVIRPRSGGGMLASLIGMSLESGTGIDVQIPAYTPRAPFQKMMEKKATNLFDAAEKKKNAKRTLTRLAMDFRSDTYQSLNDAFTRMEYQEKPILEVQNDTHGEVSGWIARHMDPLYTLFSEGPGLILGVRASMMESLRVRLPIQELGKTSPEPRLRVISTKPKMQEEHDADDTYVWIDEPLGEMRAHWLEHDQEQVSAPTPGPPTYRLTFLPKERATYDERPSVGILHDGDESLCRKAFEIAGFSVKSVTLDQDLSDCQGLVFLGTIDKPCPAWIAKAWNALGSFFARDDTFSLGLGSGCLQLSALQPWFSEKSAAVAQFGINKSNRIAHQRNAQVRIEPSPAEHVWFTGMVGSELPCEAHHLHGQYTTSTSSTQSPLAFVDVDSTATESALKNPFGSPCGQAGITSSDGRHLGLMVHPDQFLNEECYAYRPPNWPSPCIPWMEMFHNVRAWCANISIVHRNPHPSVFSAATKLAACREFGRAGHAFRLQCRTYRGCETRECVDVYSKFDADLGMGLVSDDADDVSCASLALE